MLEAGWGRLREGGGRLREGRACCNRPRPAAAGTWSGCGTRAPTSSPWRPSVMHSGRCRRCKGCAARGRGMVTLGGPTCNGYLGGPTCNGPPFNAAHPAHPMLPVSSLRCRWPTACVQPRARCPGSRCPRRLRQAPPGRASAPSPLAVLRGPAYTTAAQARAQVGSLRVVGARVVVCLVDASQTDGLALPCVNCHPY